MLAGEGCCLLGPGGENALRLEDLLSRFAELLKSMLASGWLELRGNRGPVLLLESFWYERTVGQVGEGGWKAGAGA